MGHKPRRPIEPKESIAAFSLLQEVCAALPGVEEHRAYGHPKIGGDQMAGGAGRPRRLIAPSRWATAAVTR